MADQANITLYSGNTYTTPRVLMTLLESGVPFNIVNVDISAGDQKNPEYKKKVSFSGQVPALIDTSTSPPLKLTESTTIAFYIADKYAPHLSFDKASNEYYQLLALLDFVTDLHIMIGVTRHIFHPDINPMFGKNDTLDSHFAARTLSRAGSLDARLAQAREEFNTEEPWLIGNKFTVADISAYVAFRHLKDQATYFLEGLAKLKEIVVWMERMEARESLGRAYEMFKGFAPGEKVYRREFEVKEE